MIKKIVCGFCIICNTTFASKPLTLVLDWFINPNHAPLFVAVQEGFFAQQGIVVKIIPPADLYAGEKMVATNKADIAITYQPTFTYKITQGLPLVRFATLIDSPLNCLTVLQQGPIHNIKDLRGKSLGYIPDSNTCITLSTILKHTGLNSNEVKLLSATFNLRQALLFGKIDGFTGGMRNFEPVAMELAGKPARLFYPEQYGLPLYDELIFVTHKNKINDPALKKFVVALRQGVAYLQQNPQTSWQKFAKNHPELNNTLNQKVWFLTLPYFAKNPAKLDHIRYQNLATFLRQEKLINYIPNLTTYATELN